MNYLRFGICKIISVFIIAFFICSCSKSYQDLSTSNARKAIIEEANGFLTAGNCLQARSVLDALYASQYADTDVKLVYASTYGCSGGFSFTTVLGALTSGGSDTWSTLVKADYSASAADSKVINMQKSAEIIRTTSSVGVSDTNYYKAANRPNNANIMMIFTQLTLIGVTISADTMGKANSSTGHKTQTITGLGTNEELCILAHAFYTIKDSLQYVSAGSVFNKIATSLNAVCGSSCSGTLDPSICTATEQSDGLTFGAAIDSSWSL